MREQITYRVMNPTSEDFVKLQGFAKSFNHHIMPNSATTVTALYRGDTCFGYGDTIYLPVYYPAFHPEVARPRDVVQVMSDWRASMQISGKTGYVGVPFDNINNSGEIGNFPEETMNKLGLVRMHRELYTI